MRLARLPLPLALSDPADADAARAMMIASRELLDDLERQLHVLKLAGVFELSPFLEGFSFRVEPRLDDEGLPYTVCEHEFAIAPGFSPDDHQLQELDADIEAFLSQQTPEWLHERSGSSFHRPQGEAAIPGLMRQALGPAAFARWQAGCLDAETAPSATPAPAPPRAL